MNHPPGHGPGIARGQDAGPGPADATRDPGDAVLAYALRSLPSATPPPGFAAVVARAAAQARALDIADTRFERGLARGLALALAGAGAAYAARHGGEWAAIMASTLGGTGPGWAAVGAACIAVSALPWQRMLSRAGARA